MVFFKVVVMFMYIKYVMSRLYCNYISLDNVNSEEICFINIIFLINILLAKILNTGLLLNGHQCKKKSILLENSYGMINQK